jgi:hypothetical protein
LDVVSRLKVESYPSLGRKNPPAEDYYLVLRWAFLAYGLPQRLSFDHGTVFYDPTTPSPFPTRLHLWLLALGVEVRFTRVRCPTDHALIERTHQTMTLQALQGQTWVNQTALWAGLDARRAVLNTQLPVQALGDQPPLQAYPEAIHSGRPYRPEWEEDLLNLERVWTYLAQGRWFRQGQRAGTFYLGAIAMRWATRARDAPSRSRVIRCSSSSSVSPRGASRRSACPCRASPRPP